MQQRRVIISGGGTGGHIFPAIAIANAIKRHDSTAEILFVGAKGKMEMEKVPAAGYKIEGLWISGIQRKVTPDNLAFPFKLISSLLKSGSIIRKFRPDVVVGVGGFASGPLLYAATIMGIPTLIQEQNSFPGITNRLLAKRVRKICVAYEGMERFFPKDRILFTGNPVRRDIIDLDGKQDEAFKLFGLSDSKPVIFVVGGSQGALSINRCMVANIREIRDAGVQVIWQTGKTFLAEAQRVVTNEGANDVKVFDFINRMDLAYAAATAVVSRAGASAVSELALVKKPSILVPFPFASEDHQTKNAKALAEKNAAVLITDKEAAGQLVQSMLNLAWDKSHQQQLIQNIAAIGMPDSADIIAEEVVKQAAKHGN